MYKLRVRHTKEQLQCFIEFLKYLENEHYLVIYSISPFYKDRNSLYYRVYIELQSFNNKGV